MGMHVLSEELAKEWSPSFADIEFVNAKPAATRLGLAAQLKSFTAYGFFVTAAADIPAEAVAYLAEQLGVDRGTTTIFRGVRDGAIARRFCAISFSPDAAGGSSRPCELDSDGALPRRHVGRGDARGRLSLVPGSQVFRSVA
jgi:Domain of unknown function (DUF4158)